MGRFKTAKHVVYFFVVAYFQNCNRYTVGTYIFSRGTIRGLSILATLKKNIYGYFVIF